MPPAKPKLLCSTGPFFMLPLGQTFEILSKAGFEAAEVMVTSERASQDAPSLTALSEDFGIEVGAVHAPFLLLTRAVYSTDPLEKIKRSTDLAQRIQSPLVVVHPAYMWQRSYARWLETEVAEYSEREGVTVSVENMFPVWIRGRGLQFHRSLGIDDMRAFPSVTLDTSHLAVTGIDIVEAFDELSERISHIHLSNNLGTGRDSHSPLTEGVLPISSLLERIGRSGYSGTITLELDVREWAGSPPRLAAMLKRQREFCLERLGAPAA